MTPSTVTPSTRRNAWRRLLSLLASFVGLLLAALAGLVALMAVQGHAAPSGDGEYVALGSSFAAGPGIAAAADGSPFACLRSSDNFAHLLARQRGLGLTDVSCSGAQTKHLLEGGQYFLPAQLDAVKPTTRLVTVTIGGNDLGYMGNLFAWSCANDRAGMPPLWRWLGTCKVKPPAEVEQAFARLGPQLLAIAERVHRQAPQARLVFVDYQPVLPASGGCAGLPLTDEQLQAGRDIARRLAALTQQVAAQTGAGLVQASKIAEGHDVCAADPWVSGYRFTSLPLTFGALAYRPTPAAMRAIAQALSRLLDAPH